MMSREWRRLSEKIREMIESFQDDGAVKLSEIARQLGVEVKAATLKPGLSGEIKRKPDGGFRIRVNRHDPKRRQRFTVAHEIAHFLLHQDQIGDGIEDDKLYRSELSDRREQEANRLAADILMPERLIRFALEEAEEKDVGDKALYLANQLDVSESAMSIRMESLGIDADGA
jgi:Zn-dependent peptidase ImmA (M78 family)